MRYYIVSDEQGNRYVRITKSRARNLYTKKAVYVCPVNLRPFGPWSGAVLINSEEDFDVFVNEVELYNCNSET